MSIIDSIRLKTWDNSTRTIPLTQSDQTTLRQKYSTTVITGQNGSHKSSALRAIAEHLVNPSPNTENNDHIPQSNPQVLCVSGSAADRFPQKQGPGGRITTYDTPRYTYIGQRVMSNLLSKKAPIEQMLLFALDPARAHRFQWNFFSQAHEFAGIRAGADISIRRPKNKDENIDTLKRVQSASQGVTTTKPHPRPLVSELTANWLLDEFTYDEFRDLDHLLREKRFGNLRVRLTPTGSESEAIDPNVIRLGFLTDLLTINEVNVQKADSYKLSAFELSSGEFQMYSTLLSIGFALEEYSVLLIDEPENSLHPQWQRSLMSSLFDICDTAMTNGQIIVSTHSPLIVGSAKDGSTIVDLSRDGFSIETASYGASSDELLLAQFGVGSSRNRTVVNIVQSAVSLFEDDKLDSEEFKTLLPELRAVRDSLTQEDPLIQVIDALMIEAEQ
ncbi:MULTISPECIES: ATP-binding protein [unclassified Stenotrophomonas]|uniref:AAA family ATPase n=1 Tax=unclassified Stenotrophomonas TaxID=196198 RepID=UPI0015CE0E1E|nr:ATP-binding protein [Stenotrophomonas sp. JAI102]NYF36840.1 putative ATPase [Stenotrophomonas sp. JAI102]